MKAVETAPKERAIWLDLAWFHKSCNDIERAYFAVAHALTIDQRPEHYLTTSQAWDHRIYELAAFCAKEMGLLKHAKQHIRIAQQMAPHVASVNTLHAELINMDDE